MKYLLLIFLCCKSCFCNDLELNQFKSYVSRFIEAAKSHSQLVYLAGPLANFSINRLVVESGMTDSNHILGECTSGEIPHITANMIEWKLMSEDKREALMFHELGHCILNRRHDSEYVEIKGKWVPRSLMNPFILSSQIYLENREYYLDELFSIQSVGD